jgi:antitoxin (DNA-binding transcriptional repressor) of toxin-antitoxin stability system
MITPTQIWRELLGKSRPRHVPRALDLRLGSKHFRRRNDKSSQFENHLPLVPSFCLSSYPTHSSELHSFVFFLLRQVHGLFCEWESLLLLGVCDARMHHMKKASVRDLRYRFSAVEDLLRDGEEIHITKRKRIIARLLPPKPAARVRRPDFLARLKKIFGKKRMKVSGAEIIALDRGERF